MTHYDNILYIEGGELIRSNINPMGVMSRSMYDKLRREESIRTRGRACRNTPALVEYNSLPLKYRQAWVALHGEPDPQPSGSLLFRRITHDDKAYSYYTKYTFGPDERSLPEGTPERYAREAAILNAIGEVTQTRVTTRRRSGGTVQMGQIWQSMAADVHSSEISKAWPHSLPTNPKSLRVKFERYAKEGYASLIHNGFANDNKRKVSVPIDRLLQAMYSMPQKPFAATVYDMYNMFVNGKIEVFDKETGELFDRKNFMHKGQPVELSESTVRRYLNNPFSRAIVDKRRNDSDYFYRTHRPHHHRRAGKYSLSKISADDRDLPRKYKDGQSSKYVKAYYIYDVTSRCVIGYAHSRRKDDKLFIDCMRNMFRTLRTHSLPLPGEIEVEHHIVNHFVEELDILFPMVRWCRAGNSQEKHAEHLNRAKKYGVEKQNHTNIGRWWATGEAYKTKRKKVGDQYVERAYEYDELVADDVADIQQYNNGPHPRQKTYPGMTRWEVLMFNINKDLAQPAEHIISRCIGDHTPTTICNSQYVKVKYGKYILPSPTVMARLKPNNYSVDAYYIPDMGGIISEVHLFQNGEYLCKCSKIETYSTARIEWTDADAKAYTAQAAYVGSFDSKIKKGVKNLPKVAILEPQSVAAAAAPEPKIIEPPPHRTKGYSTEELLRPNYYGDQRKIAIENL